MKRRSFLASLAFILAAPKAISGAVIDAIVKTPVKTPHWLYLPFWKQTARRSRYMSSDYEEELRKIIAIQIQHRIDDHVNFSLKNPETYFDVDSANF